MATRTIYKYISTWRNDDLPNPDKYLTENIIYLNIVFDRFIGRDTLTVAEWRRLFSKFNRFYPNVKKAQCQTLSYNGKEEIEI